LFDYSNLNIIYTSCNNNIHRSDNGGASFSSSLINNLEYTNPVIQHPLGPDTIYAWNNSLWRLCKSPDRGNTFDNSTLFGPSGYGRCSAIEICESDPDILYFATAEFTVFDFDSCCLLKTSDNGANWSDISSNMGGIMDSSRISAIEINPNNTDEVWVSFGNMIDGSKVYYSDNAGSTWSNITGDLDNFPINDLEFDNDREVLFCCNDVGVFVKAGDNDWQEYGDGLPEIMCTKLDINSEREELYVSTHGRGIWKVDLKLCYDLEDDLIISSNQTWSNEITLCSNLIIQNGATLTISGTVNMSHDVDITIKNNSTLLISSGLINNANIVVESGATLTIEQNGSGLLDSNDNISIESGGLLNFNYGAAGIID
jgi:hypothetical protein